MAILVWKGKGEGERVKDHQDQKKALPAQAVTTLNDLGPPEGASRMGWPSWYGGKGGGMNKECCKWCVGPLHFKSGMATSVWKRGGRSEMLQVVCRATALQDLLQALPKQAAATRAQ